MRVIALIWISLFSTTLWCQQSQLLYQSHYLGESNFLNPAVQSSCKWFIGIPVFSSLHINYANSGFSYKQLVDQPTDSTYMLNIDRVVDRLGRRTLIGTEFHTTLLAIGYKRAEYYFAFSIIEKNNLPFTLPRDLFVLAWDGNTAFEGESASLRGTASYATHYREYALGVSKNTGGGDFLGIKAKLLFGKLNLALPKTDVDLYTDADNFDLTLEGSIRANASAPLIISQTNGQINDISWDSTVSPVSLIFNRKNWGLAFDAGFIRTPDSRTRISGSIVDVGFIRWRSNLHNISSDEQYTYRGVLADTNNVVGSILDSIQFDVTEDPYFTWLPVKTYLGVDYELSEKLEGRILGSGVLYKTKFVPALTLGIDYNPFGFVHLLLSYSMYYGSYNNIGAGFSVGRGPVQFYMLSDNVAGMIWPMSTRNLNLRFGLNINLGCTESEDPPKAYRSAGGSCPVYEQEKERARRKKHWR